MRQLGSGIYVFDILDDVTVDSEADVEALFVFAGKSDASMLRQCRRFEFHMQVGSMTGSPDMTVQYIEGRLSRDNTLYTRMGVGLGPFNTADAYDSFGFYGSMMEAIDRLRLQLASGFTLDGSNYWDNVSAWLIASRD